MAEQHKSFHFARMQTDGRLTSPFPQSYPTIAEAKKAAPDLLRTAQARHGGKIVLVQVLEEVQVECKAVFKEFTGSVHGHGAPKRGPDVGAL